LHRNPESLNTLPDVQRDPKTADRANSLGVIRKGGEGDRVVVV